jgi:hypothetical protein
VKANEGQCGALSLCRHDATLAHSLKVPPGQRVEAGWNCMHERTNDEYRKVARNTELSQVKGYVAAGERTVDQTGQGQGSQRYALEDVEEALTFISAYGCSGNATRRVCSSSAAMRATASCDPTRNDSCWLLAGTPVIGSKRAFSCAMLQDGEIRRSEDELGEVMRSGTSAAL